MEKFKWNRVTTLLHEINIGKKKPNDFDRKGEPDAEISIFQYLASGFNSKSPIPSDVQNDIYIIYLFNSRRPLLYVVNFFFFTFATHPPPPPTRTLGGRLQTILGTSAIRSSSELIHHLLNFRPTFTSNLARPHQSFGWCSLWLYRFFSRCIWSLSLRDLLLLLLLFPVHRFGSSNIRPFLFHCEFFLSFNLEC